MALWMKKSKEEGLQWLLEKYPELEDEEGEEEEMSEESEDEESSGDERMDALLDDVAEGIVPKSEEESSSEEEESSELDESSEE